MDGQGIRAAILNMMPTLQREYGVRSLGIFGSYVRGDAQEDSDLDLLVEFDAPLGFIRFNELERRLSSHLGVKVDLVMKSALKPHIGRRILEEVQPL